MRNLMRRSQGCLCLEDLIVNLQPLTFDSPRIDNGEEVYQAIVNDSSAPEAPVYALNVVISQRGTESERKEFQLFLGQLRAAFLLVAPGPSSKVRGKSHARQACSDDNVLFIPELLSVKSGGDFRAIYIVESSIGGYTALPANRRARFFQRYMPYNLLNRRLPRGGHHTYRATSLQSGGVRCRAGKIRVDPGDMVRKAPNTALVDSSFYITVHAIWRSRYDVIGLFS
jgi:hypothetical protein